MNQPFHINTPYKHSHALSKITGFDVFLKLDNAQPTGSFKIRGMGHLCQKQALSGCKRFVCSSGGNAGMAAAYAAKKLKIPISLYVPVTTPDFTIQRLREEGADVTVIGSAWDEANDNAVEFAKQAGNVYIPPFDNPDIWTGHATIIKEMEQKPDVIICSVGGGGLFCGVVQGLEERGWNDVTVVAVETVGADSLSQAINADKLVTLPAITSLAKTLGAKTVARGALDAAKRHKVVSCVVTDKDAVQALCNFLDDEKILVEPSCAASLAVLYNGMLKDLKLPDVKTVAVVVCGGSGVNMKLVESWKTQTGC